MRHSNSKLLLCSCLGSHQEGKAYVVPGRLFSVAQATVGLCQSAWLAQIWLHNLPYWVQLPLWMLKLCSSSVFAGGRPGTAKLASDTQSDLVSQTASH